MSSPIIALKKATGKSKDVTNMCSTIEWSGGIENVARTIDLGYINAPYDPNIKGMARPSCGDYISMKIDGKELFYGRVYSIEKTSENGTTTVHCIDNSQFLLKNQGCYKFKGKTAEAITAKVCGDAGIPTGDIASTGVTIKRMICDDNNLMQIIIKAYTYAHKSNGKKYMSVMKDRKFCVIEQGKLIKGFTLDESKNITSSSYSESTEEIVNRVVGYDSKSKIATTQNNTDSQKKYGTFMTTYHKEDGVSVSSGAKALLQGPAQSLSVNALGNIKCISGYAVKLKDSATGMSGKYWIKSDKHTWQNGTYTMALELEFKNIMKTEEDDSEDSE